MHSLIQRALTARLWLTVVFPELRTVSDAYQALNKLLSIHKGAQEGQVTAPAGMLPWRAGLDQGAAPYHGSCCLGAGEYAPESPKTVSAEGSCGESCGIIMASGTITPILT